MAITFDALDRFQENKVLQTAEIIIFQSQEKDGSFVTIETVTCQIRRSEKYLFVFNHSNYVVKTELFKKEQSYFNIRYLLRQRTKLF